MKIIIKIQSLHILIDRRGVDFIGFLNFFTPRHEIKRYTQH